MNIQCMSLQGNCSDLSNEFGSDISYKHRISDGYKMEDKKINHTILFRSKKFLSIRSRTNLIEDKIYKSIYTNSLNIFFGFLHSILNKRFEDNLNFNKRGVTDGNYATINIPWRSKIRKLMQNSCFLWETYRLYTYPNIAHMNLDELKIEKQTTNVYGQSILKIKEYVTNCYEIKTPLDHKIIMDNIIIKSFELNDEEIEDLQSFEESEIDLATLRKNITAGITSVALIPKKISQIIQSDKIYKIHMIGVISSKENLKQTNTRYRKMQTAYAMIYDETGEIKIKLWSETAKKVKKGDALEVADRYLKNSILQCPSKNIHEKIHKIKEEMGE